MKSNEKWKCSGIIPILTLLLCLSAGEALATPSRPLLIRGDSNYPPYEYINEKGEPDGFNVALTRAVAKKMGLDISISLAPWPTVRQQLESNEIDVLMGMYQTDERDKKVDFSLPHIVVSYAVFVRKDSPITSIKEARGKNMIVIKSELGHDYVTEQQLTDNLIVMNNISNALYALSKGEGECALISRLQGLTLLDTMGISNVRAVGSPILQRNYCLAVSEGNSELLATFNEGLTILKASGEYDALYHQWFGVYDKHNLSFATIGKYLLMVAAPLLGVVLLTLAWNRALKIKVEQKTRDLYKANRGLQQEMERRMQVMNDLRESEERNREERELLSVTLRSIGDGVITSDVEGRVVLMNRVAERLTGWSQAEAEGRPMTEVFHIIDEKSKVPRENPVEKVLATGNIITLANHTALVRKDGREISIADSGAPIMNKESRMIGVVLVFRDVTDENRMEEELLKIKKLESVGVLAGGIAHDFNNILAALLGSASLLKTSTDSRETVETLAGMMEKACLRAKDLTQQLLTFSKGGAPITHATQIDEVIRDSAGFVLHGSKARCDMHFPENLWPVEIDPGQISQVIQNLILNAMEAMPDGGIIGIEATNHTNRPMGALPLKEERYVKIVVTDSGTGIPQEIMERVFDPYFSTKQRGSGLGLAITHSIIKKHNGHISVRPGKEQGTIFTLYLPTAGEVQETATPDALPPTHASQGTVLIMDDEEIVREMAITMLKTMGLKGVAAKDGETALKIYGETPVDLVIMDLTIPGGMGGREAASRILESDPHARLIVSSGYSNDPVMANHRKHGFMNAIVKPYLYDEFREAIHKALETAPAGQKGTPGENLS